MPVSSRVVGRLGSGMAPWPVDRLGLGLGLVFVSILCDFITLVTDLLPPGE